MVTAGVTHSRTDQRSRQTICPFIGQLVNLAKQLALGYGLGIQGVGVRNLRSRGVVQGGTWTVTGSLGLGWQPEAAVRLRVAAEAARSPKVQQGQRFERDSSHESLHQQRMACKHLALCSFAPAVVMPSQSIHALPVHSSPPRPLMPFQSTHAHLEVLIWVVELPPEPRERLRQCPVGCALATTCGSH